MRGSRTLALKRPTSPSAGAAAVLTTLLRAGMTLRENVCLIQRSRREALEDGLTGLANRRALMADLEEAFAHGIAHLAAHPGLLDLDGFKRYNAGEAVPLGARIIAVCDAYDAMRTDRPHRRACSEADALAELRRCAGAQFDPAVVEAFCAEIAPLAHRPALQTA